MSFFFSKNYISRALRIFLVLIYIFAGNAPPVFAVIYQPGETLNPSCLPTDSDCGVLAPITATSSGAFVFGGGTAPAGTLFYVSGTSTLQNIIPDGNLAYSIGTPEKRLKEVYTKDLILGASSFVMEEVDGVLRFRDASSTIPGLIIDPAIGGIINGNIVVNGGASFQNATTTGEHRIGTLVLGGNSIQNLVGNGLQVSSGTLALNTSGDWMGTFDGREGSYYLANSFSTTTADTWFGGKSTSNLTEGSNLYFTDSRFDNRLASKTTDNLAEGSSRLYYSDARSRNAFSSNALSLSYSTTTGALSLTSGFVIPSVASTTDWNTAHQNRIVSVSAPLSSSNNTLSISQSGNSTSGYLSAADWLTFNTKEPAISTSTAGAYFRGDKTFQTLDTSAVPENGNVYYTNARFDNRFSQKTTGELTEGSNLYYTDARARSALSASSGLTYASSTGVFTLDSAGNWMGTFDGQEGTYYLARGNHTGTQLASTISDFTVAGRNVFSVTAAGLSYSTSTGALSLASGYVIPLTASTTDWQSFFAIPSSRVSAGTNLSWSGNTLQGPSDSYLRGLFSASSPLSFSTTTGGFSLLDSGVSSGSYGNALSIPVISVDNKGRVTSATMTTISGLTTGNLSASAGILNSQLASSTIGLSLGTSGTDVNVAGSPVPLGGTLTLNIPDAGATVRGLITTGAQTFTGAKTFSNSPTLSPLSTGSVLFIGTGGLISENNQNLFWDDINKRLGIGTSTTTEALTINGNMQFTSQATTISLASSTAGTASALTMLGASTNAINGIGGAVNITGGTGGTNLSTGGAVNITSGSGLTGGAITLQGSNNISGGQIRLFGGTGGLGGAGGALTLRAGNSGGDNAVAGSMSIIAGNITTGNNTTAGSITIQSGSGGTTNGNILLLSGSGRVGIGTSTPSGALHVYSTSTPDALVVATSGNVGIGTSNPAGALHVVTAGNNTTILDGSGVLANNVLQMRRNGGTAAQFGIANGAGSISALAGTVNDVVLQSTAFGNNLIITNDVAGKDLIFGTAATERMRITSAGNVGIGTGTPGTKLALAGGVFSHTPDAPQFLTGLELSTAVNKIAVAGRYLYSVHNNGAGGNEFNIIDISNLASPAVLGGLNYTPEVRAVAAHGSYAYIGLSGNTGGTEFRIIDVSNPSAPVERGGTEHGENVYAIALSGRYAFVGHNAGTNEFDVVDISNPTSPQIVAGIDLGGTGMSAYSIKIQGRYAYVGGGNASTNFWVIDISNPLLPSIVVAVDLQDTVFGLDIKGRYAYVGFGSNSTRDFGIVDIKNPAAPTLVGSLEIDNNNTNEVVVAGKYAYVARDSTVNSGELFVIDISNPVAPAIIASAEVGQTVNALVILGKYAFIGKVTSSGTELDVYNLAGIDSPAAHIGALAVDDLSSAGNALVAGDLAVGSGLRIGSRGIATDGTLAINGTSTSFFAGNVGIGITAPSYRIELPNNADSSGQGRANAWVTYSDESLKENRQALTGTLQKILALQGVSFTWKGVNATSTGFIAQEVEGVAPELVSTGGDGIKSLDYGRFAPYLVEAIKEIVHLGDTFRNALISWLADAANGIGRIFAREYCGIADDGGTYCLTGEDIKRLGGKSLESAIQPSNHVYRVEENQKSEIWNDQKEPTNEEMTIETDQGETKGDEITEATTTEEVTEAAVEYDAGEMNREESSPEKTNMPEEASNEMNSAGIDDQFITEEALLNEGQTESQEIGLEEAADDGL